MSEGKFVDVFGNPEEPESKIVIGKPGNRFIQLAPDGKPIVVDRDKNQEQAFPKKKVEPAGRMSGRFHDLSDSDDHANKNHKFTVREKPTDFWSGFVCGIVATLVIGVIFGALIYFLVQYLNN